MQLRLAQSATRFAVRSCLVALTFFLITAVGSGAESHEIHGLVQDRSGAVVARASVVLRAQGQAVQRTTQPDGSFVFTDIPSVSAMIEVSASGFAKTMVSWHADEAQ